MEGTTGGLEFRVKALLGLGSRMSVLASMQEQHGYINSCRLGVAVTRIGGLGFRVWGVGPFKDSCYKVEGLT